MVFFLVLLGGLFVYATFLDDTQSEFDNGTYTGTSYDVGNSWVELATSTNVFALPDNKSATGWFDMTNNAGLWHFDEADYTSGAIESSGEGLTLTASGSPTPSMSGKIYSSADLESGSSQYFRVAEPDFHSDVSAGSINVWVNPESYPGGNRYIFAVSDEAATNNYIW